MPTRTRQGMLEKRPTRLVKSEPGQSWQTIDDMELTLKLARPTRHIRPGERIGSRRTAGTIDISTQLAIAAGSKAPGDAGIPLVMAYKPDQHRLLSARPLEAARTSGRWRRESSSHQPSLASTGMATKPTSSTRARCGQKIDELRRMAVLVPAGQST